MVAEKCERLKFLDGEVLRRKCARFVEDHAEEIQSAQPTIPEALNDRAADIWEPLFVLAAIAARTRESESESGRVELLSPVLSSHGRSEGEGQGGAKGS